MRVPAGPFEHFPGPELTAMHYALLCTIDSDRLALFPSLQAEHRRYICDHRERIAFSGLARNADGTRLEMMIIIIDAASRADAEHFMDDEPYHSHGGFSSIVVRPWSQVLPEPGADPLERAGGSLALSA